MLQITIGANVMGDATSIKNSIYKQVSFLVSISLHGHDEAQKQQQKRNSCCKVHVGLDVPVVKVSIERLHLSSNEVMLKPSQG